MDAVVDPLGCRTIFMNTDRVRNCFGSSTFTVKINKGADTEGLKGRDIRMQRGVIKGR